MLENAWKIQTYVKKKKPALAMEVLSAARLKRHQGLEGEWKGKLSHAKKKKKVQLKPTK